MRTYSVRCAELTRMRSQLELLDCHLPALQRRGVRLHPSSIHCAFDSDALAITAWNDADAVLLHHGLLSLGFLEVVRQAHPGFFLVDLKKGRLTVSVRIPVTKASK